MIEIFSERFVPVLKLYDNEITSLLSFKTQLSGFRIILCFISSQLTLISKNCIQAVTIDLSRISPGFRDREREGDFYR